jgi:hypothetical protein
LVAAGAESNANRYNMYWSGARQFTLIPTPATIALLGLGGVFAARRRRGAA